MMTMGGVTAIATVTVIITAVIAMTTIVATVTVTTAEASPNPYPPHTCGIQP